MLETMTGGVELDLEQRARDAVFRGDARHALELLMSAYGTAIYNYCRRVMRDADLAKDVCQITFVHAFRDLGQFGDRASMRAWLFGIAHHRCLDALKARYRTQERYEPIDSIEHSADAAPRPDEAAASSERRSALFACLDELSPEARAAVLLRFQEGMSYPEIAIVCGALVATLQARVVRALPVLRRCLERKGIRP